MRIYIQPEPHLYQKGKIISLSIYPIRLCVYMLYNNYTY